MPISNLELSSTAVAQTAQALQPERNLSPGNTSPVANLDNATALRPSTVTQISNVGRALAAQETQANTPPETVIAQPVPAASEAEAAQTGLREQREANDPAVAAAAVTNSNFQPAQRAEPASANNAARENVAVSTVETPNATVRREAVSAAPVNRNPPPEPAAGNAPEAPATGAVAESRAAASETVLPETEIRESSPPTFNPTSPVLRQTANEFVAAFNASPRPSSSESVSVTRNEPRVVSAQVQNDADVPRDNAAISNPAPAQPTTVDPTRVRANDSTFAVGVARNALAEELRLRPSNNAAVSSASDTQSLLRDQVAPAPVSAQQTRDVTVAPSVAASVTPAATPAETNSSATPATASPRPSPVNLAQHLNVLANQLTP